MPATAFAHDVDPKTKLLEQLGDLSGVEVFHNQVLCAVYIAPEKTKGGIIRPYQNVEEDKYQGKVGLVVKCAPRAFASDAKWQWPEDISEGDWVFYRVSDTVALTVRGVACRIVDDVDVKSRINDPDLVW
jgi:co-chaperonin GroES (HSP10)